MDEELEAPPEPPPAAKKAMYEMLTPMGDTFDYSGHILLASYYPLQPKETPAQVYAEARRTLARGLRVSPQTLTRLSGPRNVADSVFPADSRPVVSVASITSLAMPAMPSFASIRHSPTRSSEPGSWLPPPQSAAQQTPQQAPTATAALPGPHVFMERQDTAPVPVSMTRPTAPVAFPQTTAAPLSPPPTMPAPPPSPPSRAGRKNLVNIFQDAWKR
jgi:hypothetical protein